MVETTPDGSDGSHRLFATVLTIALLASVGLAAVTGTAAASHDNGVGANYTVNLPNEADHYPGETGGKASIQHFATGEAAFEKQNAKGLETLEFIVISSQDVDFSSCTTSDTSAFGIDRGSDDGGTRTDENLLDHREDSSFNENSIVVDFFDSDGIAGNTVHLNKSDQIVAVQNSCYVMPSEPGWYQIDSRINGTTYSGEKLDETGIKSHYFYVCECANEQEAREKLGPPPSEEGDGSGGDSGGGSSTATPTATEDGGDATPTEDGDATPTDGGGESTPTATSDSSTNTATTDGTSSTAATESRTSASTGGTTGDGGTPTATGGSNREVSTSSPTDGGGPGFGLVAALLALVSVAVLAYRER